MRIVFCGNPDFALLPLQALLQSTHQVAAVVTSPDRPRGRGQKTAPLPVKQLAVKHGLPLFQPDSLRDADFLQAMRDIQPDAFVVVAFRILPVDMFSLPPLGAFNIHPSLLPKGRGPAPIRWTLIRGETETGVSIIRLTEQIDGGGIVLQERTTVLPHEDYGLLHDRLSDVGARMMVSVLDSFAAGHALTALPQDEAQVTKAPKLKAEDFVLNFQQSTQDICNRIRAFSPVPGAVATDGKFRLKIFNAMALPATNQLNAGQIYRTNMEKLVVGTGDGEIQLEKVQPEGKRPMNTADWLRGRPDIPERFC